MSHISTSALRSRNPLIFINESLNIARSGSRGLANTPPAPPPPNPPSIPTPISVPTKTTSRRSALASRSRSRSRTSAEGGGWVGTGDDRDLVGIPDPISNLRPIIYASPFRSSTSIPLGELDGPAPASSSPPGIALAKVISEDSPDNTQDIRTRARRARRAVGNASSPYSNSEFLFSRESNSKDPSSSRATSLSTSDGRRGVAADSPLAMPTSSSPGFDPAYAHRLRLERLDLRNHEFWAESNLLFEAHLRRRLLEIWPNLEVDCRGAESVKSQGKKREGADDTSPTTSLEPGPIPTQTLLSSLPTETKEAFLSNFYADWVNANEGKQRAWVKAWWSEVWWTGVVGGWRSWRAGLGGGSEGRAGRV